MTDLFLGKKRDTEELTELKNEKDTNNLLKSKEKDESKDESKNEKPSLFGNAPSGGLFGNLNSTPTDNKEKKSLFGNFSFGNTNSSSLFSGGSLFNDPKVTKGSSLFASLGNQTSSIFCEKKNANSDNEDDDEDNELQRSDSPEVYKPTETSKPVDSEYNRIYIKQVDNFFTLNSEESKFVTKGKGFVSIEQHKEKTKNYHIVLRNSMGVVMFNGYLTAHLKPSEKVVKNFKNISAFACLEIQKEKFTLKLCRIPFQQEQDLDEFNKEFNNILETLKNLEESKDKIVENNKEKSEEKDKNN